MIMARHIALLFGLVIAANALASPADRSWDFSVLLDGSKIGYHRFQLTEDGSIQTTSTFLKDGFDGEAKEYNPRGFVRDTKSNATWGMRFIWPIKADDRVVYLDEDYSQTVIARQKRDFAWIMARTPSISDDDYERLTDLVESIGYEVSKIERVPQQW